MDTLLENKKIAEATHNIQAYRFVTLKLEDLSLWIPVFVFQFLDTIQRGIGFVEYD